MRERRIDHHAHRRFITIVPSHDLARPLQEQLALVGQLEAGSLRQYNPPYAPGVQSRDSGLALRRFFIINVRPDPATVPIGPDHPLEMMHL